MFHSFNKSQVHISGGQSTFDNQKGLQFEGQTMLREPKMSKMTSLIPKCIVDLVTDILHSISKFCFEKK
jgi:hypothetical protein